MSKVKLLASDALWDASNAQNKIHCTPRRLGPAEIKFPMRAEKALMLLTGKTGKATLKKAKTAYLHYAIARNIVELSMGRSLAARHAGQELLHNLDDDWTFEFFESHAERYAKYPRRNFDAAAHRKRLLKILSDLRQNSLTRNLDTSCSRQAFARLHIQQIWTQLFLGFASGPLNSGKSGRMFSSDRPRMYCAHFSVFERTSL